MTKPAAGEVYDVRLRVKPGYPGTFISRLKMALKCLLRSFGIVCESIRKVDGPIDRRDRPDSPVSL